MRPVYLTSFIGREAILSELESQLDNGRLLTLTGPGGAGKTRLAVELTRRLPNEDNGHIHWVDLAPTRDETLLPQTVAAALKIRSQAGQPIEKSLVEALNPNAAWLLLDNCEHLITACAELVHRLLQQCPQLKIIATSREPLDIPGERQWLVPPLSLPEKETVLENSEAVALFVDRAQVVVPRFTLTPENAPVVARICSRLDGLPLALELAAARVKSLSVEQIAARLDDRFAILKSNAKAAVPIRHQTLRTAIDWSYTLLPEPEQILFRRLSVFSGDWSLSSAEEVCADDDIEPEEIISLLSSLANKSLVVARTTDPGEAVYSFLETIHQYAEQKLNDSGEQGPLKDRHLNYYLQIVEETEPKLHGEYQELWLTWLGKEYDNIRAALRWSLKSNQIEEGLRIATNIYQFWIIRAHVEEGLTWLEQLLTHGHARFPSALHAKALAYATFLAGFRGDRTAQIVYAQEAAPIAEALGPEGQSIIAWIKAGEAYAQGRPGPLPSGGSALVWAMSAQAYDARAKGDFETEYAIYKQVIHIHREADEKHFLAPALISASSAALSIGEFKEARAMVDEGLPLLRETGNPYQVAMTLNGSGDLARCMGDYTRAQADYEESEALLREIGAERDLASTLHNLGYTFLNQGDIERAHALFSESITLQQLQQNKTGILEGLIGFAAMAVMCKLPAASARLLAAAVALGGEGVATTWPATKMEFNNYFALTRKSLTKQEFDAEQAAGRMLSLESAMEFAQNLPLIEARETQKAGNILTKREREVATLIAQAKSNEEIAEELVLSKRTIETHISNIRSKLGFTKRSQIVLWAVENGLIVLTN